MKHPRAILVLVLTALLALLWSTGCDEDGDPATDADADAGAVYDILVVHSYHPEYNWVQEVNAGIETAFADSRWVEGEDYNLEYYYMDTKRNPDVEFMTRAGSETLAYVEEQQPDAVILIADNAMEYFGVQMLDKDIPVVFAAVNNDPVDHYGVADNLDNPGHNISGCLHQARFAGTIEILRQLYPEATRMALLNDDATVAPPHMEYYKEQAPSYGIEVVMEEQIGEFDVWKEAVAEANATADFIMLTVYHTLSRANGDHITGPEVLEWTLRNTDLPTTATWAFTVRDDGALLGDCITGTDHGELAVEMVIKVLNGVPISTMPIETNVDGARLINETAAARLGVTIPEDLHRSCEIVQSGPPVTTPVAAPAEEEEAEDEEG
ncbi:MAG: hypothetical protein GF399_07110 [Candidatus Coatesbacteria bacterium]|nr:hypothetical protein [Candidatus Coatesbacteria bacterium]